MYMTHVTFSPRKKLFYLFLFTLCPFLASTQTRNGLAFPSANNTFLGIAGNVRSTPGVSVDMYSGAAQVSIPVCNLPSRELTIPISLNYTGGKGIRVQDYAGSTGLGWALNAGGSISRVVRGFPDEFPQGYLGTGALPSGAIGTGGQWGKVVAGNLGSSVALTSSQALALTGVTSSAITVPTADGEPDLFFVRTPTFSFQFSFDENGNPVFSNNTGAQIITTNFNNSNNYGNCSFEVIDAAGTQYFFGSTPASVEKTTAGLFGTTYTFPTTWYLDKIVTHNSKDIITLSYTSNTKNDSTYHYAGTATFDGYGTSTYDTASPALIVTAAKYVYKITSLLGEADFNYAYDRTDDVNAGRLTSVTLIAYNPQSLSNNTTVQTFNFNYSYFGAPSTDPNVLRLRLDNISVTGNTTATSTPLTLKTFTYNTTNTMPSRKLLAVSDYWGYLNFLPPSTYVSFPGNSRNPVLAAATTDVLTSIKDVNGGSWNLSYELNTWYNTSTSSNTTVGGLRVNSISQTLPTGETLSITYSYVDNTGKSTGQALSGSYNVSLQAVNNGINVTEYFTESPSEYYDLNGQFIGYSSVKMILPNGGYSTYTFSNFSDYADVFSYFTNLPSNTPDITSSISFAFKRGLLLDQINYTAAGNKVSEDATPLATSYTSLTSPVQKRSWGFKWNIIGYSVGNANHSESGTYACSSSYYTSVENFKQIKTVHYDYDQLTPANSISTTTNYTYDAAAFNISTISSADSKGHTATKQYYHPGDASIPMVTSPEQTAINTLSAAGSNVKNVVIHETDTRNGTVVAQLHNTYASIAYGSATNVDIANTAAYNGATLAKQQFYNYDPSTDNLLSYNMTGGKTTATLYGNNKAQPLVNIINAGSTASSAYQAATLYGDLPVTTTASTTFTTFAVGNIVLSIDPQAGYTYSINYTLSGPSNSSGSMCAQRSATTCSYPSSVTLTSMPVGTYTFTISVSGTSVPGMGASYTYTGANLVTTYTNEFFFEGFEETFSGTVGTSHTGRCYWNSGNYTVPFTPPNGRSYIIQWWNWVKGKWVLNEQPYTTNMTLTGIIDDIRVFPSDALMTTYTYSPLVGKTSETDPAGRSKVYQYDGLGRQNVVLDDDRNVIKKYCYTYAGQTMSCPTDAVYTNSVQSSSFTRNNCPAGYVPSIVVYTVPAGTYSSTLSQSDADQQASNDVQTNGQAYANANGTCTQTWWNVVESGNFTRNNCGTGYAGGTVTYTVAANTYSSTISQADANQKAINDVNANGQNYANTNGTCTPTATLTYGDLILTGGSASTSFTAVAGYTITLSIDPNAGTTYSLNYTLSGPSPHSGVLCVSRSAVTCSNPSTVSFSSMPAGTYTLTISLSSGSSSSKGMSYSYYH